MWLIQTGRRCLAARSCKEFGCFDIGPGAYRGGVWVRWKRERSQPLARALRALSRRHHDRPRQHDRERRLAVDSRRSWLLSDIPGMGCERVLADVRRLLASGWPSRRSLRAPAPLPHRDLGFHDGLARVRTCHLPDVPHHGSRSPGFRRRDRFGRRPFADHDHVHRAGRTGESHGRRRFRAVGRWDCWCASRRDPHGPSELALDLSRQHPGRHRGIRAFRLPLPDRAGAGRGSAARHRRRYHGDCGADARRLRHREGQRGRLDLRANPRLPGAHPSPYSRPSS